MIPSGRRTHPGDSAPDLDGKTLDGDLKRSITGRLLFCVLGDVLGSGTYVLIAS